MLHVLVPRCSVPGNSCPDSHAPLPHLAKKKDPTKRVNLDDMVEDAEEQVSHQCALGMAPFVHDSPRRSPAMSAQKQVRNPRTRITMSKRSMTTITRRTTSILEKTMITTILVVAEERTKEEVRLDHTRDRLCG